jgi:hypothetical protein
VLPKFVEQPIPTTNLESRVRADLNGRVKNFRLQRFNRGLILRGRTRCFYDKQIALHVVMMHTSLPIFANEIRVDEVNFCTRRT